MGIDEIRKHIKDGNYQLSLHAEKERYEEDISLDDIEMAILNGEILEDYPDDVRGKSCLNWVMMAGRGPFISYAATLRFNL